MKNLYTAVAASLCLFASTTVMARGLYVLDQPPVTLFKVKPVTVIVDVANCDMDSSVDVKVRYLMDRPVYFKDKNKKRNFFTHLVGSDNNDVTVSWQKSLIAVTSSGRERVLINDVSPRQAKALQRSGNSCKWLANSRHAMVVEEFDII